jgi:hypothetical protein
MDRYEIEERAGMIKWYNLLKNLNDENRTMLELSNQEIQDLQSLVSNLEESGLAGTLAVNALNNNNKNNYELAINYPEDNINARKANNTSKKPRVLKPYKTNDFETIQNNLGVYPNPADELVTIDLSQTSNLKQVKVYDIMGKLIMEQATNGNSKMALDVSKIKSGTYTCKLINMENQIIKTMKLEVIHP